jgi:hypothetical protein
MAVVLKTVTSRSFGKARASPSRAAAPRDQLSVILDAVIIKCYSSAAFVDESRYNGPLRAQSAKYKGAPPEGRPERVARDDGARDSDGRQ